MLDRVSGVLDYAWTGSRCGVADVQPDRPAPADGYRRVTALDSAQQEPRSGRSNRSGRSCRTTVGPLSDIPLSDYCRTVGLLSESLSEHCRSTVGAVGL